MASFYKRYQNGLHQEVYDELVALGERVFEPPFYAEALLVAQEMMRRVRHNLSQLISRIQELDYEYEFAVGFMDSSPNDSPEMLEDIRNSVPLFRAPTAETPGKVKTLEELAGALPLTLKCWYEEVGSTNLIGCFVPTEERPFQLRHGSQLDPLFVYSVEMEIRMVSDFVQRGVWHEDPRLPIAPDSSFKYGASGTGSYSIELPRKAFDAPLLLERHHTTFVNYLRICFRWGGFPGLDRYKFLTEDEIRFLTYNLLSF